MVQINSDNSYYKEDIMGKYLILKSSSGGVDTDDVSATAADVIKGKTAGVYGYDEPVTGTLELSGNAGTGDVLSGRTFYTTNPKTKQTGTMSNNGSMNGSLNCGQSKSIPAGYTTGGTVTANSLASQTSATATAAYISSGKTAWVNGSKITGTLATQGGSTTTPGTANKTIVTASKHVTGNIVVAGNSNLIAGNIKKGISIFGVMGTFQGYVDSPVYFYNNGLWGNLQSTGFTAMTNYTLGESKEYLLFRTGYSAGNVGIFRSNQTINLSSYNYIKIEASDYNYTNIIIGLSTSSNITDINMFTAKSQTELSDTTKIAICDVGALNGSYYLYVCSYKKLNTSSSAGYVKVCTIYASTT